MLSKLYCETVQALGSCCTLGSVRKKWRAMECIWPCYRVIQLIMILSCSSHGKRRRDTWLYGTWVKKPCSPYIDLKFDSSSPVHKKQVSEWVCEREKNSSLYVIIVSYRRRQGRQIHEHASVRLSFRTVRYVELSLKDKWRVFWRFSVCLEGRISARLKYSVTFKWQD